MLDKPLISICVPYHDTPSTAQYLSRLLHSVSTQTLKDYEIVFAKVGPFARNHNETILRAKGAFVQMLQMDDYFAHPEALQNIVHGITDNVWQITACVHDIDGVVVNYHKPEWTDDIYTGNNRLGSVSTLSMRRDAALLFEEPLTWVVDCDLYYRLYLKYGPPNILTDANVVVTERPDRLSNTLPNELKTNEAKYLIKKYGK